MPYEVDIYGRNESVSTWTHVKNYIYEIPTGTDTSAWNTTNQTIDATQYYLEYAFVVVKTNGHVAASIGELELYGTEEDLDIVARVGEGLDGKVANFRVYDKYLHEEQALELWDAQKDQFGRATSSVSVYRGHLGIGTTTPEAALTVMDEAHESEEFPPRAMTGYETYMDGHGVFKASAISVFESGYEGWRVFDKATNVTLERWTSLTTTSTIGSLIGKWVKLELPYHVNFNKIGILPPTYLGGSAQCPTGFSIIASNDDETWTIMKTLSSYTWKEFAYNYFTLENDGYFKYIAVVATTDGSNPYTSFQEIRYFGTRERGQSTLHDGELKLTKNLTVPRIGPPLNADDTPRRDRLVVEYNTSTNPTENGTVRDTSGRGLDGLMYNGAYYDATEKALVFDGVDDYVFQQDVGLTSVYSVSFWLKLSSKSGAEAIMSLGTYTSNQTATIYINSTQLQVVGYNNDNYWAYDFPLNTWTHVCVTYQGGGVTTLGNVRLYINGSETTATKTTYVGGGATSSTALTFPSPCNLYMGRVQGGAPNYAPCNKSNFKLYDTALTADAVKRLYDMGRCDEGHHVVNFSKTRVGIGLGDGEVPYDELDVRGNVRGSENVIVGPPGGHWWRLYTFQHNGNLGFLGEDGTEHGYLVDSGTVNIIDFTGQHRAVVDKINVSDYQNFEGLIVSANKNKYINVDKDITTGSNAIQISQSLPVVSLSNVVHDKACYGVISGSEDVDSRTYQQGTFVSVFEKQKGDTRAFINSVGEGAMWVTDINGPLESGDYITTSNVAGYGQKQDGAGLMNYTVAKITMDCDFEPATQPIQRIKQSNVIETHYTGMVSVTRGVPHEFVTTTVTADDEWSNVSVSPSDVTYAEWSNLEANVQNTYTLTYTQTSNVVYDVKYTKTTTANVTQSDPWDKVYIDPPNVSYAEWSNLEVNVQNTYTLTFTQTTTEDKSLEEWSVLESNTQSLYNVVYYQLVEQKVDADHPGAVKHETVTDRVENTLDEYGQLQWEDDPLGATEKAYRIRYLDASGQQTDEANCVHRAAFVGCTYHCG